MKKTFLFVAMALIFASCSDDDEQQQDTTAPQILEAAMNGDDHDLEFAAGDAVTLTASVSDNEALSQLKIDIHDVFDGHDHNKKGGDHWELTEIVNLSGASANVTHNLQVPDPVIAGPYHVILRLLDASGNESEFMEMDFLLTNGEEPQISITAPDFGTEVHAPKGQQLSLVGMITDDVDLDEIIITIEEEHDHDHKMASGDDYLFSYDEDLNGSSDTSFDLSTVTIMIPADAETGHYKFKIMAKDNEGNYGVFEEEIHVM